VDLKRVIFAGSNIYWDEANSRLTFAAEGTLDKQNYQGVFFRWGSLVGISPAKIENDDYFTILTPLYVPDLVTSGVWHKQTIDQIDFSIGGYAAANSDDADEIPWLKYTLPSTDPGGRNINHMLLLNPNGTGYKGDICRYLSDGNNNVPTGKWHVPTSYEFSTAGTGVRISWDSSNPTTTPVGGGWTRTGNAPPWTYTPLNPDEDGTYLITNGAKYRGNTFPASGFRQDAGLHIISITQDGNYFSSSLGRDLPSGFTFTYHLAFYDVGIFPHNLGSVSDATPIRCVKN
jgi:hypothetical protein